jgi:hypothetical protein
MRRDGRNITLNCDRTRTNCDGAISFEHIRVKRSLI